MKPSLIFISIIFLTINLFSQTTNTWTGAVDTSWHKACNWSLNRIPNCTDSVVIPNTTNKPYIRGIAHSKAVNVQSASGGHLYIQSSSGGILHVSSLNNGGCLGTATDNSGAGCCTTSEWVKVSNPSAGSGNNDDNENANDLVIDANYMWVVGKDGWFGTGRQQWRIEKRNLSDGNLVAGFGTGGVVQSDPQANQPDIPLTVDMDASGIYVGGYYIANPCCLTTGWRIEKRNATTGALINTFATGGVYSFNLPDQYSSEYLNDLVTNGTHVYAVGSFPSNGSEWHMKCLNATTGAQVWQQTSNPSSGSDIARAVAVDASGVYIAGSDNTPGNEQWRIEKRNLTTGALITTFGTNGAVTVNPTSTIDRLNDIAVDATGVYIAGWENQSSDYILRIEKRNLTTGALITSFGTNGVIHINPSNGYDTAEGIAVYNGRLHIVGVSNSPTQGWRTFVLDANTGTTICSTSPGNSAGYKIQANASGSFAVGSDTGGNLQWKMMKLCSCP